VCRWLCNLYRLAVLTAALFRLCLAGLVCGFQWRRPCIIVLNLLSVLNSWEEQIFRHSVLLSKSVQKCPGSALCRQRSRRK
jgi:hypothetical protein